MWYLYFSNHVFALLAMVLALISIGSTVKSKFFVMGWTVDQVTGVKLMERQTTSIRSVNTQVQAVEFIYTNLANVVDVGYNGKPISNYSKIWMLGGYRQPLNAGNLLLLFRSNSSKVYRVTGEFQSLFSSPCGFLSDDSQRTDPIKILPGRIVKFHKFNSYTVIGRSKESYPFQGHNITLPLVTQWSNYYLTLRTLINEAAIKMNSCDLRALILSWNMINIFTGNLLTFTALVEFLPTGVASASIELDYVRFKPTPVRIYIMNVIFCGIFFWNICFVAILFSVSSKLVFADRILNCCFLFASACSAVLFALMWEVKHKPTHQIIYDPPNEFQDLRGVYAFETAWLYTMVAIIVVTTMIMAFLILRISDERFLKTAYPCVLCAVFMFGILLLLHFSTKGFRTTVGIMPFDPLMFRVDRISPNRTGLSLGLLVVAFSIATVIFKAAAASVILAYLSVPDPEATPVRRGKLPTQQPIEGASKNESPEAVSQRIAPADSNQGAGSKRINAKMSFLTTLRRGV